MVEVAKVNSVAIDDIAKISGMDVPGPGTLAEDILGYAQAGIQTPTSATLKQYIHDIAAGGDWDAASKTQAYDASSRAVGFAIARGSMGLDDGKVRLIMDGVQVAESGFIQQTPLAVAQGSAVLSGNKTCICQIHNYDGSERPFTSYGCTTVAFYEACAVLVGSIKVA